MSAISNNLDRLLAWFQPVRSCAIAYSGGVDSAVVAKGAFVVLGNRAVAVTGVSASLAEGELENAVQVARQIGIRHEVIQTAEFERPEYVRNNPDRCYHCKSELYLNLASLAERFDVEVVVNGANADDASDFRPGMKAATEYRVRSPLLECGLNKQDVRDLAAYWKMSVWDKPASPCLSSRVAYGVAVTTQRLEMIDKAEQFLRSTGFRVVRVRYHEGDVARIEVPAAEVGRLFESPLREQLSEVMSQAGFKFVTVDLAGFRSGSLNSLVSLESRTSIGP